MNEVKRYRTSEEMKTAGAMREYGPDDVDYTLASDYDALASRLAQAEAEVDGLRDMLSICDACAASDHQRATSAEERLATAMEQLERARKLGGELVQRAAEAEAEVERLKGEMGKHER